MVLLRAFTVVSVILLAGCQTSAPLNPSDYPSDGMCSTSADCPVGYSCDVVGCIPEKSEVPAAAPETTAGPDTDVGLRSLGEEMAKCHGVHQAFADFVRQVQPGGSEQEMADGAARGWYLAAMLLFRASGMSEDSIEPAIEGYAYGFRNDMANRIQRVRAGLSPQSEMLEPVATCKENYGEIQKEIITQFRREVYQ